MPASPFDDGADRADDVSALPDGDPFGLFARWLADAEGSEPNDANAMALATATPDGVPSARMVLMKDHGEHLGRELEGGAGGGFVFYTNAQSRKGAEIAANPRAALLFHWKTLRRQVRIEGLLHEVSAAEADAYFHSRARISQLGSAASDQSRPLPERSDYLERVAALAAQFPTGDVPRPRYWTGFCLAPEAIEFWLDRPGRLHDRRRFTRIAGGGGWTSTLLYP